MTIIIYTTNRLEEYACRYNNNYYSFYRGCLEKYSDGGKECQDNNECNGNCVAAKEDLPNFPKDYFISLNKFNNEYKKNNFIFQKNK